MSFSRLLVLLIAFTAGFWQYGDSCVRQNYTNQMTDDHYEKLLKIDTGYSRGQLKNADQDDNDQGKAIDDDNDKAKAIDDVYGKLLCSYVYNCSHYLNLIKPLFVAQGKDALVTVQDRTGSVFFFQDKVVDMLNVLYNFGKIGSWEPLWLVYVYSSSLNSLDEKYNLRYTLSNGKTRTRLLNEHETVSNRLAQFTDRHCDIGIENNVYNDQLVSSPNLKSPEEIPAIPELSHKVIEDAVDEFKATIGNRISEITESMSIDNSCKSYFTFNHLLLRPAVDDYSVVSILFSRFAEIAENRYRVLTLIEKTCSKEKIDFGSFETLTNGVASCHRILLNVIKYVILYTSLKHVRQVHVFHKNWWPQSCAFRKIKNFNRQVSKYVNRIVGFFNLKDDDDLKCVTELFQSPSSADTLINLEKNRQVEWSIVATLRKVNSDSFQFDERNFSTNEYDKKYMKDRFKHLWDLCTFSDIKHLTEWKSYYVLESQLSFYVFIKNIKENFSKIDFEVIGSFNRFSKNKCLN